MQDFPALNLLNRVPKRPLSRSFVKRCNNLHSLLDALTLIINVPLIKVCRAKASDDEY